MYEFRRTTATVRDAAPAYGPEPDGDRYPADEVLADLSTAASGDAMARILARYAALRHWLLRLQAAPAALTDHAAESARAHLGAVARPSVEGVEPGSPEGWAEGEMLRRLGETPLREAGALLAGAAGEAARIGDRAGAAALDAAARDAMRRAAGRGPRPPPA